MFSEKVIVTYGLKEHERIEIEKVINKGLIVKEIIKFEELLEGKYFLSLINLNKITGNELNKIIKYYSEVDGGLSEKIFIGKDEGKVFNNCNSISSFDDFDAFKMNMENIIKKSYSKIKRADNNVSAVVNIINILSKIEENPGVTTKELSEMVDKSENAIKRYIEMLNIAGKDISYNYESNSWYSKGNI